MDEGSARDASRSLIHLSLLAADYWGPRREGPRASRSGVWGSVWGAARRRGRYESAYGTGHREALGDRDGRLLQARSRISVSRRDRRAIRTHPNEGAGRPRKMTWVGAIAEALDNYGDLLSPIAILPWFGAWWDRAFKGPIRRRRAPRTGVLRTQSRSCARVPSRRFRRVVDAALRCGLAGEGVSSRWIYRRGAKRR
jgi:hypothetical protein